jgi:hypothetical protein
VGKRIQLNPGWLVSLLNQWAIGQIPGRQLGYASGSSWMRGLKSSPASSIDPTGYSVRDYGDLETALQALLDDNKNYWAAVMMYHKPWAIKAFRDEGFPFENSTYYARLHGGYREIVLRMDLIKAKRAADLEKLVVNVL